MIQEVPSRDAARSRLAGLSPSCKFNQNGTARNALVSPYNCPRNGGFSAGLRQVKINRNRFMFPANSCYNLGNFLVTFSTSIRAFFYPFFNRFFNLDLPRATDMALQVRSNAHRTKKHVLLSNCKFPRNGTGRNRLACRAGIYLELPRETAVVFKVPPKRVSTEQVCQAVAILQVPSE